jgi:hypothetical protein
MLRDVDLVRSRLWVGARSDINFAVRVFTTVLVEILLEILLDIMSCILLPSGREGEAQNIHDNLV